MERRRLGTGTFIALLNPSLAFVLAAAFLIFRLNQRSQAYMGALAAGYFATGMGFLLQHFELPIGFYPTKFLSNLFFAAAALLVASAIVARYRRPVPYLALFMLAGAGLAFLAWFMFGDPNLTWRIYSMNFALGGMALVVAAEVRSVPSKTITDKVLLAACALASINFIGRTLFLVGFQGSYTTYEGLYASPYWMTAMLTHAVLSLIMALCLILASVDDMLGALRTESQTDPLSSLLNRRGFEDRARLLIDTSAKRATPLALVLADLDHFKAVNDMHGHAVGDAVIAAFSGLLKQSGAETATIGRTGGEEFAVIIPACDAVMAKLFAEGVRTALAEGVLSGVPEGVGKVTASFGVASLGQGEDLRMLLRRADEALYEAKRDGRNLVRQAKAPGLLLPQRAMGETERRGPRQREERAG